MLAALVVAVVAAVVIRFQTAEGTLVVEINDPAVEARFKNGKLVLLGPDGKERYTVSPAERDKKIDAGPYTIRVEGADGLVLDTREFTLKKGNTVAVRITLDPTVAAGKQQPPLNPEVPKNPDIDRRAAEYVLSVSGQVAVGYPVLEIHDKADLPKGPFSLIKVSFEKSKLVTDAGLSVCRGCKKLHVLLLRSVTITDAALVHFAECDIDILHLTNFPMTDKGLSNFKNCKLLLQLNVVDTKVTDAGLAHFKDCRELTLLNLSGPEISDATLELFKGCAKLEYIGLGESKVTSDGLARLKAFPDLETLWLQGSLQVSDIGLLHLYGRKNLKTLTLTGTRVTPKGVAALAKELPGCRIHWNGGVIEPKK